MTKYLLPNVVELDFSDTIVSRLLPVTITDDDLQKTRSIRIALRIAGTTKYLVVFRLPVSTINAIVSYDELIEMFTSSGVWPENMQIMKKKVLTFKIT